MRPRSVALLSTIALLGVLAAALLATRDGRLYVEELATRAQEQASNAPAASLTDLTSIDQLQEAFNSASGEPRLVLLFSPT
jgi:phosphoribosylaminoimidazole carboxylase (NCAIR synthetase)